MSDPGPKPDEPTTAVAVCSVCGTKYAGLDACPTCASVPPVHHAPLAWFVPMCTAAAGLAFAAGHAPARVKLLGLFLVAVGAAIGGVSGWLGHLYNRDRRPIVLVTTFVVTAIALVGSVLESHRLWATELRESHEANNVVLPGEPPEMKAATERAVAEATSVSTYLMRRVRSLGPWSPVAALTFLVIEVLVGSIVATIVTARLVAPDRWTGPDRSESGVD